MEFIRRFVFLKTVLASFYTLDVLHEIPEYQIINENTTVVN